MKVSRWRLECRACGAPPVHCEPGTWGGLIPIEEFTGYRECRGESLVVLCLSCAAAISLELSNAEEASPPTGRKM